MSDSKQQFIKAQIDERFGKETSDKFFHLIEKIKKYDYVVENNINTHIENVLQLPKKNFDTLTPFLEELSKTSNFASAFFIEKIPTLVSLELYDEFIDLLLKIKDYNARNLSYVLGSSGLNTDDLDDTLSEVDITYYKCLIKLIVENNFKLRAICASLLVRAKGINQVVPQRNLKKYIDICIVIYEDFGFDIADLFIENTKDILVHIKMKNAYKVFKEMNNINGGYLEFFLHYPQSTKTPSFINKRNTKKQLIALIKKDFMLIPKKAPGILNDKYFTSILVNWKTFSVTQQKSMLFQLEKKNFSHFLVNSKHLQNEIKKVNQVTNNLWFLKWQYQVMDINERFIYAEVKKTLFSGKNYLTKTEDLYIQIKKIMQMSKNKKKAVFNIIQLLDKEVISDDIKNLLKKLEKLLVENNLSDKINFLSDGKLFISTWARDPWIDYSRSDELYACTNIGDYASYNSPSFLADINVSNLDIWSNGQRRGRIYLYLVTDLQDEIYILVDRVNGSDRLIRHKQQLETIYDAVLEYAKTMGIKKILFNSAISFNNTPKQFVEYITTKFDNESYIYIKRYISRGAVQKTLTDARNSFLEALEYKEAGVVKGVLVNSYE